MVTTSETVDSVLIPQQEGGTGSGTHLELASCTVVVCVYTERRWDDINRGVAALLRQTAPPQEIVMVVDHAANLLNRAAEAFGSRITVIPNGQRQGLSGARNTGIDHSSGEVVAFLDDDAEPADDWLEQLLVALVDPAVLGVGGAAVPRWEHGRPGWLPPELDWVVGCSYVGLPVLGGPIRNPIGASMAFRRDAFRTGGFRQDLGRVGTLPLGCEETELAIRASAAAPGTRIMYQPSSVVHHHVTPDRGTWRYLARRCWSEGRSKAAVARLVGRQTALASERTYVSRTLPRAVVRDLSAAGNKRRAAAVALAVAAAGCGYLRQRIAETTGR